MKRIKEYLDYTPSDEAIWFLGLGKDETGYYHEHYVYESEEEERAANSATWSEYWRQFSQEEIFASIF